MTRMKTSKRSLKMIKQRLDVAPLAYALEQRPYMWYDITIRQTFPGSPHSDTETIFLRGPEEFTPQKYQQDVGSYDYPAMEALDPVISDLMKPLLQHMGVKELGRLLLVKLKPGGNITPHIDQGLYADYFQRYHLCITSNDQSILSSGDYNVNIKPGEVWWFDHKQQHSAYNHGDTDRIHLIFDTV